jgi:SAM-dependent methyltransferase
MTVGDAEWALALCRRSVLKQAKLLELDRALGSLSDEACLDLGGDNGVVSAVLRTRGGRWASADLGDRNVASIRALVGGDVRAIEGTRLPFDAASFDIVVVVDLLEHVEDDRAMVREVARVLRPGGSLVINVPHLKPKSLINAIRAAIGLTDAWHGHVRPGYCIADLRALIAPHFRIEYARTYSRAFSEAIDLLLNGVFERLKGGRGAAEPNAKGRVVTGGDMDSHRRAFALLRLAYPFLCAMSRLDSLLPLQPGYKLIVRARRVPAADPAIT